MCYFSRFYAFVLRANRNNYDTSEVVVQTTESLEQLSHK